MTAIAPMLVTPCVGVWIEIDAEYMRQAEENMSLPAWECGLKSLVNLRFHSLKVSHSLRGSVD